MITLEQLNERGNGTLPGHLGIVITKTMPGEMHAKLAVQPQLMAQNGYLHAGTVVSLSDTACGYGCVASLPTGATCFTTIELKSNFLGTARECRIDCIAKSTHLGRTTQVWEAVVAIEGTEKRIALFRCTQMVLWPK